MMFTLPTNGLCCKNKTKHLFVPVVEFVLLALDILFARVTIVHELPGDLVYHSNTRRLVVHLRLQTLKPAKNTVHINTVLITLQSQTHMRHLVVLPVLYDLQVLQFFGDLHAVQPLLLLVDPNFTGIGLAEHLVECQSILQCLLPQLRQF